MIDYRVVDGISHLTLNRPDKLNALSESFWTELPVVLAESEADGDVKALVLSGNGRSFCAGADISSFSTRSTSESRNQFIATINAAMQSFEHYTKPTIAAVHGHVLGGGCELTMMADIVIADETASFGLPEIRSGIMPGPGLVRGLSHLGLHTLKYLCMTGEPISVHHAQRFGLVNELVQPGQHRDRAVALARSMSEYSPVALAELKKFVANQVRSDYDYVTSSLSFLFGTDRAQNAAKQFISQGAKK